MRQHEDRYTADLPLAGQRNRQGMPSLAHLLDQKATLERKLRDELARHPAPRAGKKRGPYKGAVKLGSPHHAIRVSTGKCQADFAALASISERSLRTWEAGTPEAVSQATHDRIVIALQVCGVDYLQAMAPYRKRQAVRYRCKQTGSTWSGRGLMPAWMRVALGRGATLADFEVRA